MIPDALVQQIKSQILVRKGDVVDEALAEERARNIVAALDEALLNVVRASIARARKSTGAPCKCGFCEACVTRRVRG